MRYRLLHSAIPRFVVLCAVSAGIAGCSKDATPNDIGAKTDVKTKEASDMELAMKGQGLKAIPPKDLPATDPEAKDLPDKEPVILDPVRTPAKEIDAKEPDAKDVPVVAQATKKDKDTTNETKKDKDPKKDTAKDKDPKKEVTVPEPTEYLGKNFAFWVKQMKDDDPTLREEAMKAVLFFGPAKANEAVPEILKQLERHKKLPVDLAVRVNGVMALSTIFKYAKSPPPDAKDPERERALAIFKLFLKDDQIIMKVRALQGLPYLGIMSRKAIEDVIPLVSYNGTWEVRKEAILTLVLLAPDEKGVPHAKALQVLRYHMDPQKEKSYLVRMTAVQAIAALAEDKIPFDKKTFDLLDKALDDPSPQVKLTALKCIALVSQGLDAKKPLDPKDPKDREAIARRAKEKEFIAKNVDKYLGGEADPILRIWAHATIMTVLKDVSKSQIQPIIDSLKKKTQDPAVKVQALTVIGLCGDKGKLYALDAIYEAVADPNLNVAVTATHVLVALHAVESISMLQKIVDDKKANEILKEAAEDAVFALNHNEKLVKDKDKNDKDKKTPDKDKKTPDKK